MSASFSDQTLRTAAERLGAARTYAVGATAQTLDTKRFVIVTSGRSGSELLVSLLDSHPRISCDGEIFQERRMWPARYLNGRVGRAARQGYLAYGWKLQPNHISEVQQPDEGINWVRAMYAQGWRVIRLRRANRLHQAISVCRAIPTQWHYRAGDAGPAEAISLDPDAVIGTMYVLQHRENELSDMLREVDYLDLTYEDDLRDPEQQSATVIDVCQHIGIEPRPTVTDLARVTPRHIRDTVANYDQIAEAIRANKFVQHIDD